jgi:hypothetical protein
LTFTEEVDIGSNLLNTTQAMIDLSLSFEWEFDYTAFKTILQILDMITMAYFCAEYIVRFICAPKKKTFFFAVSYFQEVKMVAFFKM